MFETIMSGTLLRLKYLCVKEKYFVNFSKTYEILLSIFHDKNFSDPRNRDRLGILIL